MSVPPEMLQRIQQGRGNALPGGAAPGPAGTPMATPQKKEGQKEIAHVKVHIGMNMFEAALGEFGSESKEGKALLKVLTTLAKEFGDNDSSDLVPAEMMQMFKGMPQMGGGSEMQQQIAKMMQQNKPAQMPQGQPQQPQLQ